jgi:hypothetical protein
MGNEVKLEVQIARLEEKLAASDKALSLAEKLAAASTVAARAQERSQWSSIIAVLALIVSLYLALHGNH